MRNIVFLFCFLVMLTGFPQPSTAQSGKDLEIIRESNKIALVIGNSDYRNGFSKLNSPRNDAVKMAETLKRLGFRLVGGKAHLDATFQQMDYLLDQFTEEIKHGGVGFFYFSGHGSQDNNKDNFLVPVDTSIKYQSDLKYMAMKVELVTSRMEAAENRLNILVLDACRNNPLPSGFKSGNKGLNTSGNIPGGVYIAFAARDGQTAADGDANGLSLYTGELLKNMETPNDRLEDIFIKTRVSVKQLTKNAQFPMDYGSLDGVFYFKTENRNAANGNVSSGTNKSRDRIKEAIDYFNSGLKCESSDYDCKISNYTKAINLHPSYIDAYNNRGIAYKYKKEYDRAIENYNKILSLNPNYASAYNNLGNVYLDKKDYPLAILEFNKAIEKNPYLTEAYNNRGIAYRRIKNYDQAIRDFSQAIELNPNNASAYNNRGNAYKDRKYYDQAIREYTKAIELDPQKLLYYKNRAITYVLLGDMAKAQADIAKAGSLEKKP